MTKELILMLRTLGLTEYEARAYVTLVRSGVSTAEQLSGTGNIPLPRVYDTLVELQRKGFVLISKTRPKRFRPISVNRALNNFLDVKKKSYEKEIKGLKKSITKITKNLSSLQSIKKPTQRYEIWSTERRKNVQTVLENQVKKAKKEIIIFSGDMSWLPERTRFLRNVIRKGVKIRAVIGKTETRKMSENIKKAKQIGIKIKTGYEGPLRGHVVDNILASIATKFKGERFMTPHTGIPSSELDHQYELVIFNNPIFVNSFKENFEFWWNNLR